MKRFVVAILCLFSVYLSQAQSKEWLMPLKDAPGGLQWLGFFQTEKHLYSLVPDSRMLDIPTGTLFRWNGNTWADSIRLDTLYNLNQLDEQNDTIVAIEKYGWSENAGTRLRLYDGKNWVTLEASSAFHTGGLYDFIDIKFYNHDLYILYQAGPTESKLMRYHFTDHTFTTIHTFQVAYNYDWHQKNPNNKINLYLRNERLYVAGMYDSVDHTACQGIGYTNGMAFQPLYIFKDNYTNNLISVERMSSGKFLVERKTNSASELYQSRLYIMENDSISEEISYNLYSDFLSSTNPKSLQNNAYGAIEINGEICFMDHYRTSWPAPSNAFSFSRSSKSWTLMDLEIPRGVGFYFKNKKYVFANHFYLQVDSGFGVTGTAFVDMDDDCKFSSSDSILRNHWILLKSNNHYQGVLTDENGFYEMPLSPNTFQVLSTSNTFEISSCMANPYKLDSAKDYDIPIPHTFKSPYHSSADATLDIYTGTKRRGQNFILTLRIANQGKIPISVEPSLQYSSKLSLIGTSTTPSSNSNHSLKFPAVSANFFSPTLIDLEFYLHPDSAITGDSFIFIGSLSSADAEVTTINNTVRLRDFVRGPYDPNVMIANPENEVTYAPEKMVYTVHFQNIGSDTAFDVRIADTISSSLNLQYLKVLEHSGNTLKTSLDGQVLSFFFPDIKLAPKSSNDKASQGYLVFEIGVKNRLEIGEKITNAATIYFDYEDGIRTNDATVLRVAAPITNGSLQLENIVSIFPNPVADWIQINPGNGIRITDVKCFTPNGAMVALNTKGMYTYSTIGFPTGNYFMVINTNSGSVTKAFFKQ